MIKIDSKAWDEGFKAGESDPGPRQIYCPYPETSNQAFSWYSGFIEGEAKRQGYSYSRGSRQS